MSGSSNTSSNSTTTKDFKATTQNNPYYTTSTDKYGNTVTNFKDGTAGQTAYKFVNENISNLLNQYLNPTLDSATNQAKIAQFAKTQNQNLQNNIINPLANSNMLRSSQATNMYNNLSNQSADYANSLLANSQSDTANMINTLMNMYTMGYTGAAGEQANSVNSSLGAGSTYTSSSGTAK